MMMEADFKIGYRAKIKHQAADELSRLITNGSNRSILENDTPIMAVTRSSNKAWNSWKGDTADGRHAEWNSNFENDQPKLLKVSEARQTDTYCSQIRQYVRLAKTSFICDKDDILLRKAHIDGEIQKLLPKSLWTGILNHSHYSLFTCYSL